MNSEEIKQRCHAAYAKIKEAEDELTEVRSQCKHEHTHRGLYQWRIGSMYEANICDYCGTPMEQEFANHVLGMSFAHYSQFADI